MDPRHALECGADVAAYALGALDAGELAAFERHLDQCAICRDELVAFRTVVERLPMSAPEIAAPRALRARVMASVAAAPKSTPAPVTARRAWWPQLRIGSPRLGLALATVLAALVVAGALVLPGSGGPRTRVINAQVIGLPGQAQLRVAGDHGELIVNHLAPPPAGQIYEVWLARPGRPAVPAKSLFSVSANGSDNVDVPGSLKGVSAVMVTQEPAGGSPHPTNPTIIRATLSS